MSLPPLLWDYKCTTISQVWTHVLFHAGQELYQLCDLSLSEKFPNDSFLTPADPVPQCSDYSGLSPKMIPFWPPLTPSLDVPITLGSPHSSRSCFALHKRKRQGFREWEAGGYCQPLQRQLRKQSNFQPRNKRPELLNDPRATLGNRFQTP